MPSKRTPKQIIADFMEAWALEHDPAHIEVTYRQGYYYLAQTEAGQRANRHLYLSYFKYNDEGEPAGQRAKALEMHVRHMKHSHEQAEMARRVKDSEWHETLDVDGFTVSYDGSLVEETYMIELCRNHQVWCETRKAKPEDVFPAMTCDGSLPSGMTPDEARRFADALRVIADLCATWNRDHEEATDD